MFVKQVESQPLFEQWLHHGWVWKENLSKLYPLLRLPARKDAVIGEYVKQGHDDYGIRYCHPYFQCFYGMDEKLWQRFPEGTVEKQLLHRLRRVNSRNALTHRLLETIAKEQKDYFSTGDILRLKPLSQVELAKRMNQSTDNTGAYVFTHSRIFPSWLSRIIPNLTIMLPNGSARPVRGLLSTRRDRIKWALREFLNEESHQIMEGVLQAPYDDCRLQELLHGRFDISTTRRNISAVRRELGIPSTHVRSQGFWYLLAAPFSDVYRFTAKEIASHVPQISGVYEIRLKEGQVTYPKGASAIFYIGRSKNLKKRLMEHLRAQTGNETVAHYIQREPCVFRFFPVIEESSYTQEEKRLYDLFISTFGAPPAGNRVSPGGTRDEG